MESQEVIGTMFEAKASGTHSPFSNSKVALSTGRTGSPHSFRLLIRS